MTQFSLIAAFTLYLTGESGILYAQDFTHRSVLPDTPASSYTNGTRLDYFYMPRKRPAWFVDNAIPRAGDSSVDVVWCTNYGAVMTSGDFSISFNQNSSTAMMKGLYSHEVGNISLYFGWK